MVQARGEAMQAAADATPSGMVSVLGLEQAKVEELCDAAPADGTVADRQPALSRQHRRFRAERGRATSVERLAAEQGGARTIRLAVAGAFHTTLMKPADEALAAALARRDDPPAADAGLVERGRPAAHRARARFAALLVRQVLQPVLWEQTMRNLLAAGCDRFYEIGPGRVLAGLLKRVQRKVGMRATSARDGAAWSGFPNSRH